MQHEFWKVQICTLCPPSDKCRLTSRMELQKKTWFSSSGKEIQNLFMKHAKSLEPQLLFAFKFMISIVIAVQMEKNWETKHYLTAWCLIIHQITRLWFILALINLSGNNSLKVVTAFIYQ